MTEEKKKKEKQEQENKNKEESKDKKTEEKKDDKKEVNMPVQKPAEPYKTPPLGKDLTNTPIPDTYKKDGLDSGTFVKEVFHRVGIEIDTAIPGEMFKFVNANGGHTFKKKEHILPGDIVFFKMTNNNTDPNKNQGIDQCGICLDKEKCITVMVNTGVTEIAYDKVKEESYFFVRYGNQTPLPKEDDIFPIEPMMSPMGAPQDVDEGFEVTPTSPGWVKITKLPKGKTYCEPIYPDYIMVGDSVPEWVLSVVADKASKDNAEKQKEKENNTNDDVKDGANKDDSNKDSDKNKDKKPEEKKENEGDKSPKEGGKK